MLRALRLICLVLVVATAVTVPTDSFARGRGGGGGSKGGTVNVRPHVRKDGTYVGPHHRTAPDSNKWNNWSTKGNANPYTGKPGTKEPY